MGVEQNYADPSPQASGGEIDCSIEAKSTMKNNADDQSDGGGHRSTIEESPEVVMLDVVTVDMVTGVSGEDVLKVDCGETSPVVKCETSTCEEAAPSECETQQLGIEIEGCENGWGTVEESQKPTEKEDRDSVGTKLKEVRMGEQDH